jgi:hypothetical protein
MAQGRISPEMPEIRRLAVEVYSRPYESNQTGLNALAGIEGFYQEYYPEYYASNQAAVQEAIKALQEVYQQSVYPEQKSDWSTHPNNIGHKDSPGCFRCHDGKHLNEQQEAVRLECNLCHSVPVVSGPSDFVANIEISRGPEPESHLSPNWIGLHNQAFNDSCTSCHTTEDPGGTSNSSFCSNSACHGNVWEYAGFDAPRLREVLLSQLPPQPTPMPTPGGGPLTFDETISLLFETKCSVCHGAGGGQKGLDLTSMAGVLEGGTSGPAIVPGDPQGSLLVQIQSADQPHFSQLTPDELSLVVEWIAGGAPEN